MSVNNSLNFFQKLNVPPEMSSVENRLMMVGETMRQRIFDLFDNVKFVNM